MEEERPDFINTLPYEILQLIVSLIPLKDAVRTCILSTKWRSLLTPFQVNLEFDSDQITSHEATEKLKKIMGFFLRTYESPQQLKLSRHKPLKIKNDPFLIATKGVDKELHLTFFQEKTGKSDFNLILEPTCLNSRNIETSRLSSLKTLHLRSVSHFSKNFVSALFSDCQLLESLKLEKCSGLQNINIKATNCLQRLIVIDCKNMVSITLFAPNLTSFWYRGVLPTIQMKSTQHLVDVILNLRDGLGHNEFDCEDVLSLLASLKDIEILTLSGWLLEWLCTAGVIFGQLEFKFNKLKELWWIDSMMNRHKRDSIACFLNMTSFLEKLYIKIDQNCSPIPCPFFHEYWHEPHLWMDYATVKSNASQLKHLKIVNLAGFTEEEDQLLLMDLLLQKAIALKLMTVTSPGNRSWWVAKIPQSQLKKISSGHPKSMVVSFTNAEGFIVLIEENNNGLCLENDRCL